MTRAGGGMPRGVIDTNVWRLHEAKARFSEVVRRAHHVGPQHVSVHGRDEVVILSVADYERLRNEPSGQLLIDAIQSSPHRDVELETPHPVHPAVRDVSL